MDPQLGDLSLRSPEQFAKLIFGSPDQAAKPKIVRALESGASGAVFYFIMEFCDGGSAWDLMLENNSRLSLAQAKPIILGALETLAFAHDKGFVHRDFKPHSPCKPRNSSPATTAKPRSPPRKG